MAATTGGYSSVLKRLFTSRSAVLLGISAVGLVKAVNVFNDYRGMLKVFNEAIFRMSISENRPTLNYQKYYVFLESSSRNMKARGLFKWYASPVLSYAQVCYSVIIPDEVEDMTDLMDRIALESNSSVIFAGDDRFISKCLNAFWRHNPQYIARAPIGVIPLGKFNRFYDKLSPTKLGRRSKIASATFACICGSALPVHPLIITDSSSGNEAVLLDSIKSGHLADYDYKLVTNKYWIVGGLRKLLCYLTTVLNNTTDGVSHSISVVNAHETHDYKVNSTNVTYNPMLRRTTLQMCDVPLQAFNFQRIHRIYKNSDNSFITNGDVTIESKDLSGKLTIEHSDGGGGRANLMCDGEIVHDVSHSLSFRRSQQPVFSCYVPVELEEYPLFTEDLKNIGALHPDVKLSA